jgi:MFS family permease
MTLAPTSLAPARRIMSLRAVVGWMGLSQIIGYGTIFYSYAILAPGFAAEFCVAPELPFTIISVALLISGLVSPFLGRQIDRHGAPRIMVLGSVAVGLVYALAAFAPSFATLAGLIVLLQVIAVAVLYGASFPTLAQFGGAGARRAITQLTLIAGFASTLFWPLTGWLLGAAGWRGTFLIFAALHLLLALPIHLLIARRAPGRPTQQAGAPADLARVVGPRRFAFWMVALSFGITGILSTALVVHLVPILEQSALGENTYVVSMLVGPAMVLVRLGEALFWANLSPLVTTALAALCFPLSIGLLLSGLPSLVAGCLFALFYGFGHGLNVIVGGTLPLHLFGRAGYAELLGKLNAIRVVLSAGAPAAFSAALAFVGFGATMTLGAIIGVIAVVPLILLGRSLARNAT